MSQTTDLPAAEAASVATATEPAVLVGRCRCHHWTGWGDAGSLRMRAMCAGSISQERPSDGRRVCKGCTDCNPADSEGYAR